MIGYVSLSVQLRSLKLGENCRGDPLGRPKKPKKIENLRRYSARRKTVLSSVACWMPAIEMAGEGPGDGVCGSNREE